MRLKHQLATERVDIFNGQIVPICASCNKGIFGGVEMHEALISRGNVRGNKDLLVKIMVRENCVLVHPGSCHRKAETEDGKIKCLNFLIRHETYENVKNFLLTMNAIMQTQLGSERLSIKEK
jgi:hypothetical protein